ncbi:28768_t:CDS:1, partial [Gigaspora margarita]
KTLGKVKNVKIMVQNIAIPISLQVLESSDDTLLLGTNWFQKANARIYFDQQKLYLHYLDNSVEVPISNNGVETLAPYQNDSEYESDGGDTFDEFEYEEDNETEEVEGQFVEWSLSVEENPALYLTSIEEVPVKDDDEREEKTVENKILELVNSKDLTRIQEKQAQEFLLARKNMFARGLNDLGCTN